MIAIFADTTTWLSEEFLVKIPSSVLNLAIENLNSISGVYCKQIKGDVKLSGNWEALVTAHTLLQHCLDVNSDDADGEKKYDVDDSVDDVIIENETSVTPPKVFTIKKEKDADWPELKSSSVTDTQKSVSKFGRERTNVVDYADEDTQDIDIEEVMIKKEIKTKSPKSKSNVKIAKKKGKYQCTKCDYIGKLEKQLENHMNRKHLRKYKCSDCGKKYGFKADLTRHRQEVHVDRDKYFCKICNKYLKTKGYIEDHMQLHNDNYVYHCKVCEKSFSTKLIFGKHIKIKHPKMKSVIREIEQALPSASDATVPVKEENPPAVTEPAADSGNDSTQSDDKKPETVSEQTSDIKLNTSEIMMENLLSPEGNDKVLHETEFFKVSLKRGRNRGRPRIKSFMDERTEFKCHLCDYIGKKECHLEYHIKRNHSQKLICEICNKQFGYNWDLKRHREQVHAEASFFCHICSKAYKVKKSFDEHLKSHEEGYVKSRYPCTECNKTFSAKQVLDNHMKYKHLGVKQKEKQRYLCQTCGQEFYHKYSYLSHMNKHQGLLPYNCDICGKAFASEHSVKEHQIVHRDTRNHICKFCPKTFKTSSALKAHEAIHSSERSFKCAVCGKGFVQKQSLLRHERIHSGYKPYKCRLCDRPFTDSATIRKHMILVHKKDPHNWQGDVLSDLKRPREFWPEDWEADPKNPKTMHYGYKGKLQLSTEEQVMETNTDTGTPTSDPSQNTIYTNMPNMAPLHDATRPQLHHSDPNMMIRTEPLSLVQPPVSMHLLSNAAPPPPQPVANSSLPSSMVHMSHQDHISGHTSPPDSAVEIAAASILNLSSQLPPLPAPMSHISPVHMDGQMPSILNLSTMHNMSYNHHGTN